MRLPESIGDAPIEAIFNPLIVLPKQDDSPKWIRTFLAVSSGRGFRRLDLCQPTWVFETLYGAASVAHGGI
jgi:hypothetical protein